ncbi:MAG: ABC transporter ATP-binding protein [Verrucomicrobiae bacterium]|nr:ABC transporter ATP-binding protein [Verrucomicrobiae bacterium]
MVKGVSLHVNTGEIVTLLGANGAGKSTLLRAVAGLLPVWSGDIRIHGRSIVGEPAWTRISHSMMLVPEGRQLFGDMTVWENLLLGGYHNLDRRGAIDEVFDKFPRLRERSRQLAGTLSGGEQQMLALGRALVARPRLLLLDEPSLGLAPLMVREVFNAIEQLREDGVTIFLVEQNAVAALEIADRAYVIETGEIILEGEAADLLTNPEVRRAYLGKGYKEIWE